MANNINSPIEFTKTGQTVAIARHVSSAAGYGNSCTRTHKIRARGVIAIFAPVWWFRRLKVRKAEIRTPQRKARTPAEDAP